MNLTVEKLKKLFVANNVPEWYYTIQSLGGGDCYGISNDEKGWYVFFSERGYERNKEYFKNEHDACLKLVENVNVLLDEPIKLSN